MTFNNGDRLVISSGSIGTSITLSRIDGYWYHSHSYPSFPLPDDYVVKRYDPNNVESPWFQHNINHIPSGVADQ